MIYLESSSTDPAFNLALEQFVFEQMDRRQEYFMLWQNANTVVVGKNQNTFAEVNQRAAEARGVRVVRRLSGGGAVYHDLGNLNFTFLATQECYDVSRIYGCSASPLLNCSAPSAFPQRSTGATTLP